MSVNSHHNILSIIVISTLLTCINQILRKTLYIDIMAIKIKTIMLKSIRKKILAGLLALQIIPAYSPAAHSYYHTSSSRADTVIPAVGTIARQELVKIIKDEIFSAPGNQQPMLQTQSQSPYSLQHGPEELLSRIEVYLERKDTQSAENVFTGLSGELVESARESKDPYPTALFKKLTKVLLPDILEQAKRLKKIHGDKKIPQKRRYDD